MKVVLKYARSGAARYISHLDMQRAFGRAVRRANIAAEYSQGFNPHIIMSFASPLSVGYSTEGDYLEMGVLNGTDLPGLPEQLNAVLTEDIRVLDAFELQIRKKLMALNDSAAYRITFAVENEIDCDRIKCALESIKESSSYVTKDRRGKEVDIRPLIRSAEQDGATVTAVLKNASDGALNPAVLAQAVLDGAGMALEYEICRTECYCNIGGQVAPFTELKGKADESR